MRKTVLPYWSVALAVSIGIALAGALWAGKVYAEPRFQVQDKNVSVTLYDEPCALKEHVANLPYRAVWVEKGQAFEGCFGAWSDAEFVVAYFSDKTIAVFPFSVIKKLVGV